MRPISHGIQRINRKLLRRRLAQKHLRLIRWHPEGIPQESRVGEEEFGDPFGEEDRSELGFPDRRLLGEGRGVAEGFDLVGDASEGDGELGETEGPAGVAS